MLESHQLHYHGGGISNGAAQPTQDPFEFRPLKVEPDSLCMSQAEELAMLRVRVQQLEREMARLAAENHHLKDLLVKEIPGLLSAMRHTLAPGPAAPAPAPAPAAAPVGLSPGQQPDLLCSLSSSPSSCVSSLAHADRGYGLLSWAEHGGGGGPESIPSISELLRSRHEELDGSGGSAGSAGSGGGGGGGGLELLGGLESLTSRGGGGGDVMKFELSEELEDELAPFLRELGPRGPSATPCGASPCQQEMRMRGRPPGCGQLGDHCHVEQEEVFPGSGVFCDARALRRANQSSTPTAMVRNLLVGVFDKHTLLNSNLRGGSSKTSPYHNHHAPLDPQRLNAIYEEFLRERGAFDAPYSPYHNHHAPLDPQRLNAIYDATLARFPSVRRAQIGISINSKLSEIRFYTRRASSERSRQ